MNTNKHVWAENLYLILTALFITSLISCNLIANKFISIDLGFKTFIISAGVLPYPITFLITDILSEIYGRKKTNKVVILGFIASIFTLSIIWIGGQFSAIENSPINNSQYQIVFQNTWKVILASMIAYLSAQFLDVRLFHFWKKLTNGKHLWLRNNASTMCSQLVDTTLVVCVLFAGSLSSDKMIDLIFDGWIFKTLCAFIDTPIFYILNSTIRKKLRLNAIEEVK